METRKYIDCSEQKDGTNCTLKISGNEDEVVKAASAHAISVHGAKNEPALKSMILKSLKVEMPTRSKVVIDDMNAIM